MANILNPQRLVQLSRFSPKLSNTWYLIAAVTFSVCNAPQEIPILYHYVMLLQNKQHGMQAMNQFAQRAVQLCLDNKLNRKEEIDEMYRNPSNFDKRLAERFRETLLKTGPLAGLPKAINSLHHLSNSTPASLRPHVENLDPKDQCTSKRETYKNTVLRVKDEDENMDRLRERGLAHWNEIYDKVSPRVMNDLNSCYPDLWYYTFNNVYSPLFSFDEILTKTETSLIIIASLVPQDVNPQLKGHLRGALNVGCDKETVEAARSLSIMIAQFCGVKWKSEIVKL
ncbi:hypothetical protein TPHA_0I02930 [Tetrapisispora phaffii CBS 4417]|uniref:Carboxymuconolactone decarboxylase-like domain-containing protein n=1 Tax=Tetrapisispora phaffii (strain ATCC 24235 / CBS 4417 / NBRC 1672 / NRRL Y-8282 / UCD 70-5) TaxID=1071381 RepID=G8BY16_TETPH|nr:hypothetical protein TPHA_0I02930 [Tetrapisispora phaffii CBS 4417]CCE64794.1 hypothetical protein TPHA_0I02930 [Tetrapisispora phaffii CBS 4417]